MIKRKIKQQTTQKIQCPKCEANYSTKNEEAKFKLAGKIDKILKSRKDPYQKKIALFNWLKTLKVGELEPVEEETINVLLRGKLYNELAKQSMKEYKKLTIENFSKSE